MNTTTIDSIGQKVDQFANSKESLMDFNINTVINNMASCLLFDKEAIKRRNTEKCTILTVPLPKPIMIDDLAEDIEKLLKLSILAVNKSEDGKDIECVAYSKPSIGDMIIIHIYSHIYGVIESFDVNVYDSMEKMYQDLVKRVEYQKTVKNTLVKAPDLITIFKQFI